MKKTCHIMYNVGVDLGELVVKVHTKQSEEKFFLYSTFKSNLSFCLEEHPRTYSLVAHYHGYTVLDMFGFFVVYIIDKRFTYSIFHNSIRNIIKKKSYRIEPLSF